MHFVAALLLTAAISNTMLTIEASIQCANDEVIQLILHSPHPLKTVKRIEREMNFGVRPYDRRVWQIERILKGK